MGDGFSFWGQQLNAIRTISGPYIDQLQFQKSKGQSNYDPYSLNHGMIRTKKQISY